MGISPIILDNSILQENAASFPPFPTANKQFFNVPSSGTNFIVPAGVNWIGAKIWGAGGASGADMPFGNVLALAGLGGNGSYAELIISVTPGEVLQVRIGGAGGGVHGGVANGFQGNGFGIENGGINGGGSGGNAEDSLNIIGAQGGGGGGYSGIFNSILSPSRAIAVVGGGGGGTSGIVYKNDSDPSSRAKNGLNGSTHTPYTGSIANSNTLNAVNGFSITNQTASRTMGGGGGGLGPGVTPGFIWGYFGTLRYGGGGGNPLAILDDSSIRNFSNTLSNPPLNYRKISIVRNFNNGMSASNDLDFIAAGNNFCAGATFAQSAGRNGLVVISW